MVPLTRAPAMMSTILLLGAAVLAWIVTGQVRRYAVARLLDVPNARSSHSNPTPRGGGVAIVLAFLAGMAVLAATGAAPRGLALALGGGGGLIALIGWVDDHGHVSARVRAAVHLVAAAWAVYWLGGLPSMRIGNGAIPLGPVGAVLGAVGIVWLTNLYNFMDGIDGIAGGEAVSVSGIGGLLLVVVDRPDLARVPLLLAAACAGFLVWNWPPARIFMGDVGSGFIGFLFGAIAVASENAGAVPLLVWMLLLGVFIFDATVTLIRRMAGRERWFDAHQSHAYQRAVQAGLPHLKVTGTVLLINVVLGALAVAGTVRPAVLLPSVAAGLLVLTICYRRVERARPMQLGRTARSG